MPTQAVRACRRWALLHLPLPAQILVGGVVSAYAAVLTVGFLTTRVTGRGALLALAMTGAAVVSAEVSMRFAWPRARKDRLSSDLLGVWRLPLALLLPPVYVAIMVLVPAVYVHLRIWRSQPVKLLYNIASYGLAYAGASVTAAAILGGHPSAPAQLLGSPHALGAVAAAAIVSWAVNFGLVALVVAATAGRGVLIDSVRRPDGLIVDAVSICIGITCALLWLVAPAAVVLALPPVLLLQHQVFSGLREAVRRDLLTDVANPQFWREVAGREVERAHASAAHLAVLVIDVDHFKSVNDRHGHLVGDEVLAAVARTISKALRPGDLVGRLGGEEFGAILAGLNLLDAERAGERVRTQAATVRVRSDDGAWVGVTVSVGVAELTVSGPSLHDLLGAADKAMYVAKAAGRNQVRAAGPCAGQVIDLSADRTVIDLDYPIVGMPTRPAVR